MLCLISRPGTPKMGFFQIIPPNSWGKKYFNPSVDPGMARSTYGQRREPGQCSPGEDAGRSMNMKVMVIVKATKNSEAGAMPTEKLIMEMGNYNEQLVKAGIMLDGAGLLPSVKGRRVKLLSGGKRNVVDGPFSETKELIAGFWMWQVKNMEEAVEWARRCPDPMPGEDAELEIRQVASAEDFGAEFTPELQERENKLRDELERQQKKA